MTEPVTPSPQPEGIVATAIRFATTMSFWQILALAGLVAVLLPTYLVWRVLNDPALLNKVTSHFEEISNDKTPCTIRIYSMRGHGSTWAISTGLSFQGGDRYLIAVHIDHQPDPTMIQAYCETVTRIVAHMQRPEETPSPTAPGTDTPLIWHYPSQESP